MQSLTSLAFSRLPVEDYSTLVKEGYVLPEEFGTWETWRERAVKDFAISPEYFDLPLHDYPNLGKRNISPQYRYLEIQTKFYLSPECAVSVSPDGEINGIYESLTGVYESLRRNDAEMVLFFAQRLKASGKDVIMRKIRSGDILHEVPNYFPVGYDIFYFRTLALRTLASYLFGKSAVNTLKKAGLYPEKWQMTVEEAVSQEVFTPHKLGNKQQLKLAVLYLISLGKKNVFNYAKSFMWSVDLSEYHVSKTTQSISTRELLLAALCSGDVDLFEQVKEYIDYTFHPSPPVMQVLANIPLFLKDVKYDAPVKTRISQEIFDCIIYGGNPRIYLYVMGYSKYYPLYNRDVAFSGYYSRNNQFSPEGFFSINTIFNTYLADFISTDIDIDYYSIGTSERDFSYIAGVVVLKNLGYIEVVSSFYPLLGDIARKIYKDRASYGYPLSLLIMQNLDSLPPLTD
ncbi:hypothetical protein [Cedratvirus kamchatka]|uniref:Uncharacterized protein n=1 Tax=Cedratvirus kamchatka TaxID=2716914 RepID=A0A6G8MX02_9VIRU|nr:hypothetical protein [Cedratvirus kamchatka]